MKPIDKIPIRVKWVPSGYYYLVDDTSQLNLDGNTAIFIDKALEMYDHAQDILRKLAGD